MGIRMAEATAADAVHFAKLAETAADGFFAELFGGKAESMLRATFMQAEGDNSHRHTAFLQIDGAVAGMLHAYAAEQAQEGRTFWLMLRHSGWQALRFLAALILYWDVMGFLGGNLERGDFYIAMLAIYPPQRGLGHGRALLNSAAERAAGQGCSRLVLDVDERNATARAVYERFGFVQIAASKPVAADGESWRILRLALPL